MVDTGANVSLVTDRMASLCGTKHQLAEPLDVHGFNSPFRVTHTWECKVQALGMSATVTAYVIPSMMSGLDMILGTPAQSALDLSLHARSGIISCGTTSHKVTYNEQAAAQAANAEARAAKVTTAECVDGAKLGGDRNASVRAWS